MKTVTIETDIVYADHLPVIINHNDGRDYQLIYNIGTLEEEAYKLYIQERKFFILELSGKATKGQKRWIYAIVPIKKSQTN